MSVSSTVSVPPEVSTSCTKSMNDYVTAYNTAYQEFQTSTSTWRKSQPSKLLTDYPTFMTELKLTHPVGMQSTDVDVLDADCRKMNASYGFCTHETFGTCNINECPGYIRGKCKITDAAVAKLVEDWKAAKPTFVPPDVKKIICMECLQHAENVIETGKNVLNPDIVQRALQYCSLSTPGTTSTAAPNAQKTDGDGNNSKGNNSKLLSLGGATVVIVVILLLVILFIV